MSSICCSLISAVVCPAESWGERGDLDRLAQRQHRDIELPAGERHRVGFGLRSTFGSGSKCMRRRYSVSDSVPQLFDASAWAWKSNSGMANFWLREGQRNLARRTGIELQHQVLGDPEGSKTFLGI